MEIRYITPDDDMSEISGIYEQSWKFAYKDIIPQTFLDSIPKGKWVNTFSKGGLESLVMTENGKPIGTASFCPSRWDKFKEYGEIVSIYFLPDHIGKGYGKALFERCITELKVKGFDKVLLWVLEDNTRARRFYKKNGFVCQNEFLEDNIGGKDLREVMYSAVIETLRRKRYEQYQNELRKPVQLR